jgi:hypothetical protein
MLLQNLKLTACLALVLSTAWRERLRDKWLYPVSVVRALLAEQGRNSV